MPSGFPAHYPTKLEAQTEAIRIRAFKKFPTQNEILNLCGYFIKEMTSLLCDAVKARTMTAGQAMGENGMDGLLCSWRAYNSGHNDDWHQFRNEVRKLTEWDKFVEGILEAEKNTPHQSGGRPRKNDERELVREKKAAGKTWKQIAAEMDKETGQKKSQEAYRSLFRSAVGSA